MRTLDEVIKAMNWCTEPDQSSCSACPYADDDNCYAEDALQYLKEYRMQLDDIVAKRKALEAEKDRYAEAVRNCELAENKYRKMENELNDIRREHIEQMKNVPLTWEQLKQMEGKPVWVEDHTGFKNYKGWILILDLNFQDKMRYCSDFYGETLVEEENLGKTWQAYRKERK